MGSVSAAIKRLEDNPMPARLTGAKYVLLGAIGVAAAAVENAKSSTTLTP